MRNQVVNSIKDYHSEVTETMNGFGNGPVDRSNEKTQYSVDNFAISKYLVEHLMPIFFVYCTY